MLNVYSVIYVHNVYIPNTTVTRLKLKYHIDFVKQKCRQKSNKKTRDKFPWLEEISDFSNFRAEKKNVFLHVYVRTPIPGVPITKCALHDWVFLETFDDYC